MTSLSGSSDSRISSWAMIRLRDRVVDRRAQEDDAVLGQPGVGIPFHAAARRVLDEARHRDVLPVQRMVGHRIGHASDLSSWDVVLGFVRFGFVGLVGSSAGDFFGTVRSITFPSSSTTVACSTRNSSAFPRGNIRAYRLQHPPPFEIAPYLFDLLFQPLGQADDLGVDLGVARPRWPPARRRHAAPGRRARPARRPSRTSSTKACGSAPVACEVLLERRVLVRQAVREILDAPARLVVDEHFRRGDRHEVGHRFEHLVAHGHLRLQLLHDLEPAANVGAQLLDRVELARFVDPLVGQLGKHLLLRFLHDHAERRLLPGAVAEALGQRRVELEDRAGTRAVQLRVELGHDHVGADAVEEVGDDESLDLLAVDRPGDVDGRVRVVDERLRRSRRDRRSGRAAGRPAGRRLVVDRRRTAARPCSSS